MCVKCLNKYDGGQDKILPPSNDWVFKLLFGDERNKSMLIDLLGSFLELPDEEYELTFLNPYVKPEEEDDKEGILDVRIRTKTGKIINIEIQVDPFKDIGERISFYKSKLIVEQIAVKEAYNVIKKVICVCITGHVLFKKIEDYINGFKFINPKNGLEFDRIPEEIYTIEIPKVPKESDGSNLWAWLQFLRSRTKEEFEMVAGTNPEIRKAADTLYKLSADDRLKYIYEAQERRDHDLASYREEALMEGEKIGKINVAKKMKARGRSLEEIIEDTGISREEAEKL